MRQTVAVGLLGLGTVGSAVVKVLERNRDLIADREGLVFEVKRALVRDASRPRPGIPASTITADPARVLDDPEVRLVVELLGGTDPARDYVVRALRAGKTVVTANKALLAEHGHELFAAAAAGGAGLYFEGSVGGGIPIIRPLKSCLAANRVLRVAGILNGTCNYILTRMSAAGQSFAHALAEAQAHGYAEADPTADVGGGDTARKLAILSSIAFGSRVPLDRIEVEGITQVGPEDIRYGHELGWELKLLGVGAHTGEGLELWVGPAFLDRAHPLAAVAGVNNAIAVLADAAGTLMFYGQGAGGEATASAVIGDMIAAAHAGPAHCGCGCYRQVTVADPNLSSSQHYLRMEVDDRPGVLAEVARVMASHEISLHSVIQKRLTACGAEVVFVTHRSPRGRIKEAVAELGGLAVVKAVSSVLRVA